jgi:hypothetical protein
MVVNRSSPGATVVPILVYEDVGKAIDWLCGTFGFRERLRAAGPGGSVVVDPIDWTIFRGRIFAREAAPISRDFTWGQRWSGLLGGWGRAPSERGAP